MCVCVCVREDLTHLNQVLTTKKLTEESVTVIQIELPNNVPGNSI